MHFESLSLLMLLWLLPLLFFLFFFALKGRKRIAALFAVPAIVWKRYRTRYRIKAALFLCAAALIIMALSGPAWTEKTRVISRSGRDVVFLVDVSRSMLARDLAPNRLERAKLAVGDALSAVDGDRVALVAFAGNAVIKCPLTWDYSFFRSALSGLSVDSVSRGGSLLGDALRKIREDVFDDQAGAFRHVILLTDGGDGDSFPEEAAIALGEAGIRLLVIGLGDEGSGARIPLNTEAGETVFLTYEGREVWSRLDSEVLRSMALSTPKGRYLNAGTGNFDMAEIYRAFIRSSERGSLSEEQEVEYENMYQLFLLAGLLLLFPALFLPLRLKEEE